MRRQDATEWPQEGPGHPAENVIELIEDVVRGAILPAERGLRGEKEDPGDDHPDDDQPLDELQDDQNDLKRQLQQPHQPRSPKIARPILTMVDPSSIATSKSSLIPIDRSFNPRP